MGYSTYSRESYLDKDSYILHLGRLATGSGLFGLFIGLMLSIILGFSWVGIIVASTTLVYLFVTGFWGTQKVNQWFGRLQYNPPPVLRKVLQGFLLIPGILIGWLFFGFYQHFFVLLAMRAQSRWGIITSQIILIPKLGIWIADKIHFFPAELD